MPWVRPKIIIKTDEWEKKWTVTIPGREVVVRSAKFEIRGPVKFMQDIVCIEFNNNSSKKCIKLFKTIRRSSTAIHLTGSLQIVYFLERLILKKFEEINFQHLVNKQKHIETSNQLASFKHKNLDKNTRIAIVEESILQVCQSIYEETMFRLQNPVIEFWLDKIATLTTGLPSSKHKGRYLCTIFCEVLAFPSGLILSDSSFVYLDIEDDCKSTSIHINWRYVTSIIMDKQKRITIYYLMKFFGTETKVIMGDLVDCIDTYKQIRNISSIMNGRIDFLDELTNNNISKLNDEYLNDYQLDISTRDYRTMFELKKLQNLKHFYHGKIKNLKRLFKNFTFVEEFSLDEFIEVYANYCARYKVKMNCFQDIYSNKKSILYLNLWNFSFDRNQTAKDIVKMLKLPHWQMQIDS